MIFKIILFIIIYHLSILSDANLLLLNESTDSNDKTSNSSKLGDENNHRNLFLAVSLTSLFIYLLSLSMVDFISKEKIPEVLNNRKVDSKSIVIFSKYLIKIIFGKWSSNLEFQNTFLTIEFNSQESKIISSSFAIPTIWLKKLMDYVGTKDNPVLKAIKFWVYQPESLGIISSVKINLKNSKKLNLHSFIFIDSIELSKVSDDKIQVINMQKYIKFSSSINHPLNIELGFKQNTTKIAPFDGYSPYFSFCDYFFFYIIYLDASYLTISLQPGLWFPSTANYIIDIVIQSLINCLICTSSLMLIATFYLFFIKLRLSIRHNSEFLQAINILFLTSLFICIFLSNFLVSEFKRFDLNETNKKDFFYQLLALQIWFPFITFMFLWILNKYIRYKSIVRMIVKPTDLEEELTQSGDLKVERDDKQSGIGHSAVAAKRQSDSFAKSSILKTSKMSVKRPVSPKRNVQSPLVKRKSSPIREGSPIRRMDSDNSIGSGYYQQMITATKHVRSISQYGELLKESKY